MSACQALEVGEDGQRLLRRGLGGHELGDFPFVLAARLHQLGFLFVGGSALQEVAQHVLFGVSFGLEQERNTWRWLYSAEVVFELLTQWPRVRIGALLLSSWTYEIQIGAHLVQKYFGQRSELSTTKRNT